MVKKGMQYFLAGISLIAAVALGYIIGAQRSLSAASEYHGLPATQPAYSFDTFDAVSAPKPFVTLPPPSLSGQPSERPETFRETATHDHAKAQALARQAFEKISKDIQIFEPGRFSSPHPDLYFTSSQYSSPGLCGSTAISFEGYPNKRVQNQARFLVVGSFIAPPFVFKKTQPGYGAYIRYVNSMKANCAVRKANSNWFTIGGFGDDGRWNNLDGAPLLDGVIAAARTSVELPFKLTCKNQTYPLHFCDDPRKSLANLNPRDIANIYTQRMGFFEKNCHRELVVSTHGDHNGYVRIEIHQDMACSHPIDSPPSPATDVIISEEGWGSTN